MANAVQALTSLMQSQADTCPGVQCKAVALAIQSLFVAQLPPCPLVATSLRCSGLHHAVCVLMSFVMHNAVMPVQQSCQVGNTHAILAGISAVQHVDIECVCPKGIDTRSGQYADVCIFPSFLQYMSNQRN